MLQHPRVTIGLPVHNGDNYLASTIESILGQDFDDLELVITDNGSDDATPSICEAACADPRVRYLRSDTNRGATWNYNRLVEHARGDYFKWAAHDDLLEPSFVRACLQALESADDAVVAYPRTILIGAEGEVLDDTFEDGLDLRDHSAVERFRRYLAHPGEQHAVFGLIPTPVLRQTGLIANCWGGDQVLLAQLLLRGTFREVPERLFRRRYHERSSLVANSTPAAVARWYDPTKLGRTALPRTRLTAELTRVVLRSDIAERDRLRCIRAVGDEWVPRYWRVMAGECRRTITARVRPSPHRQTGATG